MNPDHRDRASRPRPQSYFKVLSDKDITTSLHSKAENAADVVICHVADPDTGVMHPLTQADLDTIHGIYHLCKDDADFVQAFASTYDEMLGHGAFERWTHPDSDEGDEEIGARFEIVQDDYPILGHTINQVTGQMLPFTQADLDDLHAYYNVFAHDPAFVEVFRQSCDEAYGDGSYTRFGFPNGNEAIAMKPEAVISYEGETAVIRDLKFHLDTGTFSDDLNVRAAQAVLRDDFEQEIADLFETPEQRNRAERAYEAFMDDMMAFVLFDEAPDTCTRYFELPDDGLDGARDVETLYDFVLDHIPDDADIHGLDLDGFMPLISSIFAPSIAHDVVFGDLHAGQDTDEKTIETCKSLFSNVMNFRGTPEFGGTPPTQTLYAVGEQTQHIFRGARDLDAQQKQPGSSDPASPKYTAEDRHPLTDATCTLDQIIAQQMKIDSQKPYVTYLQFHEACDAIWTELQYQNSLPRRTADEAKDTAGFATLGRAYLRKLEDHWSSNPGVEQPEGNVAVTECLHDMRKLAAIFVRAMITCGIRPRA